MTKNDRANTNDATTQRIERDEAAMPKAPRDSARAVTDQTAASLADDKPIAEMARRAAREQTAAAWKLATDLAKRSEREAAAAAAAAREAIGAECEKLYREIVLVLAAGFVALDVDERVVRRVSKNLERIRQRRRARLRVADDGVRLHEAHDAMVHLEDYDAIWAATTIDHSDRADRPMDVLPAHVAAPPAYPSIEDLVTGLAR